ncbi:MAG TPA: hypothetical protein VI504_13150 [Candidatus Eisenbacteria bacterium]
MTGKPAARCSSDAFTIRNLQLQAWTLLFSLLLGAGLHEWHHLRDPGCGATSESRAHACWCSSLHASANVVQVVPVPVPAPVTAAFALSRAIAVVPRVLAVTGPPRAPPAA